VQRRFDQIRNQVGVAFDEVAVAQSGPIISDRPLWLARTLGTPTLALPDEPVDSVLDLARAFGAQTIVVVEQRGPYPQALLGHACFARLPDVSAASVFVITEACR
jgi:hypothetical protein